MTLPASLRQSLFIAGTDTGVGKTWVAVRLLHALGGEGLRTAAMKPVAAGADVLDGALRNEDALALMTAANVPAPYELVNPCCFPAATSPHLAAARDGKSVDLDAIKRAFSQIRANSDVIIVEGAGGWLAPIADPAAAGDSGPTMEDVALALGLPVLLVVGLKLGCISHALLTAAAVRRAGLSLADWIANPVDPAFSDQLEYTKSLQLRLPAPQWVIPELSAG